MTREPFKIFAVVITLFIGLSLHANGGKKAKIDSMVSVINFDTTSVETRILTAVKVSRHYRSINMDSSRYYWKYGVEESRSNNIPNLFAHALLVGGQKRSGFSISERYELLHGAVKVFTHLRDTEYIARSHRELTQLHKSLSDTAMFQFHVEKAEIEWTKIYDTSRMSQFYFQTGFEYYNLRQEERSLEQLLKGKALALEMPDSNGYPRIANWLGITYSALGQYDSAYKYQMYYIQKKKSKRRRSEVGEGYRYLSYVYSQQGDIERAIELLDTAYMYFDTIDHVARTGLMLVYNAKHYYSLGNYQKAEEYLDKVFKDFSGHEPWPTMYPAYELGSIIYDKRGRPNDALNCYRNFVAMRDSVDVRDDTEELQHLMEIQALEEIKKETEREAMRLQQEQEKKEAEDLADQRNRKIINSGIGVGVLGLVIVLVLIYRNLKQKKKANEEISLQKEIIEHAHEEIKDSIAYAKRIQAAILPSSKLIQSHLPNSFVLYEPKDVVAGDFYWMEVIENAVLYAAADCTGHGVPGAMVSVVCNNALNRAVREFGLREPGMILDKVRELVVEEFDQSDEDVKDGMDIALVSVEKSGKIQYAGAHNALWIIREGGVEIEETKADKQPIGVFEHSKPFTTHTLNVGKGDTIYTFSDGYADQFGGEKGKKLKSANFKKLLLSLQGKAMKEQGSELSRSLLEWRGDLEQIDDVCVIGVRI